MIIGWAYTTAWVASIALVAISNDELSVWFKFVAVFLLMGAAPSLKDLGLLFQTYDNYVNEERDQP